MNLGSFFFMLLSFTGAVVVVVSVVAYHVKHLRSRSVGQLSPRSSRIFERASPSWSNATCGSKSSRSVWISWSAR